MAELPPQLKDFKWTALGGGHGIAAQLSVISRLLPHTAAAITMADDGGSSRKFMDTVEEIDLPVGDYTRIAVATSDKPGASEENTRFGPDEGERSGHTIRNINAVASWQRYGGPKLGLEKYRQEMRSRSKIWPVTFEPHTLVMEDNGVIARGESAIDKHIVIGQPRIWHEQSPAIDPDAENAILESDVVVIGPGSFLGSVLAACTDGVREALKKTAAKKFFVVNAANNPNDPDWGAADYISSLQNHGVEIDYAICNRVTEEQRNYHRKYGRVLVENHTGRYADIPPEVQIIEAPVLQAGHEIVHDPRALLWQVLGAMAMTGASPR